MPFPYREEDQLFPQRRLRRRQASDRHAERAATDIIQTDFVAEDHTGRVAAVFAADADLQPGRAARPFSTAIFISAPTPS